MHVQRFLASAWATVHGPNDPGQLLVSLLENGFAGLAARAPEARGARLAVLPDDLGGVDLAPDGPILYYGIVSYPTLTEERILALVEEEVGRVEVDGARSAAVHESIEADHWSSSWERGT